MDTNDIESELDRLKADLQDEFDGVHKDMLALFELASNRANEIGALADEVNQLAMMLEETARLATGGAHLPAVSIYERLREIRERVAKLILDPADQPFEEFTILHHVRANGLDEALKLADALSESRALAQQNSEVITTRVTAGVRELSPKLTEAALGS